MCGSYGRGGLCGGGVVAVSGFGYGRGGLCGGGVVAVSRFGWKFLKK